MTFSRERIAATATALPAVPPELLALAIGYRCGLDPACSDQWLESLHETIRDGARMGYRAFCDKAGAP